MGFIVVMGTSAANSHAVDQVHPRARTAGYTYFIHYPRDPLWLKSFVVILVAICVIDTVAIGYVSRQLLGATVIEPLDRCWSYNWSIAYRDSQSSNLLCLTCLTLLAGPTVVTLIPT